MSHGLSKIDAVTVRLWLEGEAEIALVDIREHGQYGEAHPLFAVSIPYSRFEPELQRLVPGHSSRLVLLGDGDELSEQCAALAIALGYSDVHVLSGGVQAWSDAGYTLYAGVNVPSKVFGELLEHARQVPVMTAEQVQSLQASGNDHVILDGRPVSEFCKMSIPGAVCCPNGELPYRLHDLVSDDKTTVVINCAGRTRSILGAQTLIDAGIKNPVFALENGTQGWFLAGMELDHGAASTYSDSVSDIDRQPQLQAVAHCAAAAGVTEISVEQLADAMSDTDGSLYLLDVRTAEEFNASSHVVTQHAPGGQLVQSTDSWIAVRNAMVVLFDFDGIRAPMAASWLARMGHKVRVFSTTENDQRIDWTLFARVSPIKKHASMLARIDIDNLDVKRDQIVDLRPSQEFLDRHIDGARWAIRPTVRHLQLDKSRRVVLTGPTQSVALVAKDLQQDGFENLCYLTDQWHQSAPAVDETLTPKGLRLVTDSSKLSNKQRIDHLFFTDGRHQGNVAASRQYLEWEINLVNQLDEGERTFFDVG